MKPEEKKVYKAFIEKKPHKWENLKTDGQKIVSNLTGLLAQWNGEKVVLKKNLPQDFLNMLTYKKIPMVFDKQDSSLQEKIEKVLLGKSDIVEKLVKESSLRKLDHLDRQAILYFLDRKYFPFGENFKTDGQRLETQYSSLPIAEWKNGEVKLISGSEDRPKVKEALAFLQSALKFKKSSEGELQEKSVSQSQQQAAGAALAVKKWEASASSLKGASKSMEKMSKTELEKFAATKHKGLPKKVNEETEPQPKFKVGDSVEVIDDDGEGGIRVVASGKVVSVGSFDEYNEQYRYKVKISNNPKVRNTLTFLEKSLRKKEGVSHIRESHQQLKWVKNHHGALYYSEFSENLKFGIFVKRVGSPSEGSRNYFVLVISEDGKEQDYGMDFDSVAQAKLAAEKFLQKKGYQKLGESKTSESVITGLEDLVDSLSGLVPEDCENTEIFKILQKKVEDIKSKVKQDNVSEIKVKEELENGKTLKEKIEKVLRENLGVVKKLSGIVKENKSQEFKARYIGTFVPSGKLPRRLYNEKTETVVSVSLHGDELKIDGGYFFLRDGQIQAIWAELDRRDKSFGLPKLTPGSGKAHIVAVDLPQDEEVSGLFEEKGLMRNQDRKTIAAFLKKEKHRGYLLTSHGEVLVARGEEMGRFGPDSPAAVHMPDGSILVYQGSQPPGIKANVFRYLKSLNIDKEIRIQMPKEKEDVGEALSIGQSYQVGDKVGLTNGSNMVGKVVKVLDDGRVVVHFEPTHSQEPNKSYTLKPSQIKKREEKI